MSVRLQRKCDTLLKFVELQFLPWFTPPPSVGIPHQVRKRRLGHSNGSVTESYTHTFTQDEREAAEKLGELFGTDWPESGQGKVISFPSLSQNQEGLPARNRKAPRVPTSLVAGAGFEPATFGL